MVALQFVRLTSFYQKLAFVVRAIDLNQLLWIFLELLSNMTERCLPPRLGLVRLLNPDVPSTLPSESFFA